jgi:hypothetical protein
LSRFGEFNRRLTDRGVFGASVVQNALARIALHDFFVLDDGVIDLWA